MSTATTSNSVTHPALTVRSPKKRGSFWERLTLFLPLVVVIAVFTCSPNYRNIPGERTNPLGGDFLHDYTGGVVITASPERLYEQDYFRSVQHDASVTGFRWSAESYYPPVYPPFYYLAVSPLSRLDYRQAMILWGLLSACAMIGAGELFRRYYATFRVSFRWPWLGALLFGPTIYSFNIGHKSMFLMLIVTTTFILLHKQRPFTAGVVFGIIAFKPHLAIVIGLAMLMKGQWRFVGGAAAMLVTLVGISLLTGWDTCIGYYQFCLGLGDYVGTDGYQLASAYSLWGVAKMMLPGASPELINVVTACCSIGIVALLVRVMWGRIETASGRFALQFSALLLATVLLSPHFYYYDLTMILPAIFLIVANVRAGIPVRSGNETGCRTELTGRILAGLAIAMLVLAGSFATFATLFPFQPGVILIAAMIAMIAAICRCRPDSGPANWQV